MKQKQDNQFKVPFCSDVKFDNKLIYEGVIFREDRIIIFHGNSIMEDCIIYELLKKISIQKDTLMAAVALCKRSNSYFCFVL